MDAAAPNVDLVGKFVTRSVPQTLGPVNAAQCLDRPHQRDRPHGRAHPPRYAQSCPGLSLSASDDALDVNIVSKFGASVGAAGHFCCSEAYDTWMESGL